MQLGTNEDEAKFLGRTRSRKDFVKTRSMRSSCWRTSRKMVTVRFKTLITGLKEQCWERLTNGLRRFIASDNYSAAEVGLLRRGQRPFKVARPKINGDRSEVLRERAVDSTKSGRI